MKAGYQNGWLELTEKNYLKSFTLNPCWIPINSISLFFYLVTNSFAYEEGGNMVWQHILKKELVDILHGLHLLSLCLKTTVQQEVHTATQLILRERKIANMKEQIHCEFFCLQISGCAQNTLYRLDNRCLTHTHIPVWQVWGTQCRRWPAKLLTWSEGPLARQACGITHINIFIAMLSHNLASLTTVTLSPLHYNPSDSCLVFYSWWGLCAGSSINDGDQKLPAMWVPGKWQEKFSIFSQARQTLWYLKIAIMEYGWPKRIYQYCILFAGLLEQLAVVKSTLCWLHRL